MRPLKVRPPACRRRYLLLLRIRIELSNESVGLTGTARGLCIIAGRQTEAVRTHEVLAKLVFGLPQGCVETFNVRRGFHVYVLEGGAFVEQLHLGRHEHSGGGSSDGK